MTRRKADVGNPAPARDAAACYAAVVEALIRLQGVSQSTRRGFGFSGLSIAGKLFAMPRGDELLLKLPAPKVAALIACGDGAPFDAGKSRPMKEWVTINAASKESWVELARQAMRFVG